MTASENTRTTGNEGVYEFTMQYGGRELSCRVEKKDDKLNVSIDNNMNAVLEVHWDGTITQISGNKLPDSNIEFIKKHVMEHNQ
jgi:hypothetical protein